MTTFKTNFIIGAQRSGTTYLYNIFDRHPDIYMAKPFRPEPKFFLDEDEVSKGQKYYLNKYYSLRKEGQVLVEKSTSYIESIKAGENIKTLFPDARIIVSLRNPVERAISNYFFSRNNGLETRTIEEVFLDEKPFDRISVKTSVSPFAYLERGEYVKYLKKYYNLFSEANIGVFIFEEFINNKEGLNKVSKYLGIDDFNILPEELSKRVNFSEKDEISTEIRAKLNKYYRSFNEELEILLRRNLNIWKS